MNPRKKMIRFLLTNYYIYLFSKTYEKTLKLPRSYFNINLAENQIESMKILLQKSCRKSDCNYEDIITKILQKIRLQL